MNVGQKTVGSLPKCRNADDDSWRRCVDDSQELGVQRADQFHRALNGCDSAATGQPAADWNNLSPLTAGFVDPELLTVFASYRFYASCLCMAILVGTNK